MESIYKLITRFFYQLFGNKKLNHIEKLCLQTWSSSLSEIAQKSLASQLSSDFYIQRQADGAKTCFYWKKNQDMDLFINLEKSFHSATITLISENKKTMKVKIFINSGTIFSIEFPKRPDRYKDLHGVQGEWKFHTIENHCVL